MSQKEEDVKGTKTLAGIKNRILVFSGKGGVGKSTVSANLALGLSLRGKKVGALDVDIHGPNLAKMLGAEGRRMEVADQAFLPVQVTENLKLVSMSFLIERPALR